MATAYNLDKAGFGGNHSMWWLIRALLTSGCTCFASGSGTAGRYRAGNVFDLAAGQNPWNYSAATGTAKLNSGDTTEPWCSSALAWIGLTLLDGSQLIIQRGSTGFDAGDAYWSMGWAPNGDWILAGAAKNVCPSTTTSGKLRWLRGAANGAGINAMSAGTVATRTFAFAKDVASSAGRYTWGVVEIKPSNLLSGVFCCDALTQAKSDMFRGAGKVACVFLAEIAGLTTAELSAGNAVGAAGGSNPQALIDFGGGTESWDTVPYLYQYEAGGKAIPNSGGAPAAGQPDVPIVVVGRLHGGLLGISDLFLWQSTARVYPDYDTAITGFYIGDVFVKMLDGATVPSAVP
jgi:hypothetical protein